VTVSAVARYAAERGFEVPWIAPDESIYALLGRSLWETGTPSLLGADGWGYSLLYPALIGWPLTLGDLAFGVELVQAFQAIAMSATAVVVYRWGREPLGAAWALVAAALSVAIPGLAYSGLFMSEALVYPLTTLALAAMATALSRPTPLHHALVLGAAALALLTHVRAAALVPALFLAVAIQCGFARSLEPARRQARLLAATATLVALIVAAFALSGKWSDVFGVYAAATSGYELGAAAESIVWHLGGIFVLVAGIPLVALAAMIGECGAGRERDNAAQALVATTAAWTIAIGLEVGVFASNWVDHIAERELLTVAPPLFLVFGLWLRRGLPRPAPWTKIVALVIATPVVLLPVARFAVQEAALDAFSFVPLWQLAEATSTTTLEVLFALAAAALVAAAVFVPRRAEAVLPALVGIVLVGLSVVSTREISQLSRLDRAWVFDTGDPRWLDRAADGPVAYVHGSAFPVGAWKHAFWNRRIDAVAQLDGAAPLAPLVPVNLALRPDGGLEQLDGRRLPRLLVTPAELELQGERIAQAPPSADLNGLALWRAEQPVRLDTWRTGVEWNGDIIGRAEIRAYRCGGGRLELTLFGKQGTPLELRANGLTVARPVIAPNEVWNGTIPAPADADGRTTCLFELVSPGLVGSTRLEFVRP
jgi:hypothetical protein